jgi:hypothetical protein
MYDVCTEADSIAMERPSPHIVVQATSIVYDASDDACLNSGGVLEQAANQAAEACEEAHPTLEEDVARVYDGIEQATDEQRKELEARAATLARRQVGMASEDCDIIIACLGVPACVCPALQMRLSAA